MNLVIDHIAQRAEATPTLTAVRHSGDAVTFGNLDRVIADYSDVVTSHGMGADSALVAGLLHSLPQVTKLSASQIGEAIRDMLTWLGRDVDFGTPGALRAV